MGVKEKRLCRRIRAAEHPCRGRLDLAVAREVVDRCAGLEVRADLQQRLGPKAIVGVDLVDLTANVIGLDARERAREVRVVLDDLTPQIENIQAASRDPVPGGPLSGPLSHCKGKRVSPMRS